MNKKDKKVPELRFPEFTEEWEEKRLGEIGIDFSYGINSAATNYDGKNKYIRITDIDEKSRKFVPNPLTSPSGIIEKKYKLKENDIVFARTGASVGKSYLYDKKDGNIFYAGFLIKVSIKNANSKFVFYTTLREKYNKWVQIMSMRSGQPGINAEEYKGYKVTLPTLPEQAKIADFLTAVDKRIELLQKKKENLEKYKKGIMQKIFSQEIRFKDENGNDFPDWEEKRLGDVLDYLQPTKYLVSDTEYGDKYKTPVLTAGKTFLLGYTNEKNGVFSENLPVIIFDDFTTAFQYVDFPFKVKSSALKILIPANKKVNIKFVFEIMKTIKFPLAEHKRYWISEFQNEKIPCPSIEEQQKIANFLSSIDKSIETVEKQIEQSQQWKKGLLQKMFV